MNFKNAIDSIYNYRKDNIIIGLTGRTGSGCSTAAKILSTELFNNLSLNTSKDITDNYLANEEVLRNKVISDYLSTEDRWKRFNIIEVSAVILTFVLDGGKENLINYINNLNQEKGLKKEISIGSIDQIHIVVKNLNKYFEEIKKYNLENISTINTDKLNDYLKFYLSTILIFKQAFKSELNKISCYETIRTDDGIKTSKLNLYTFLMQKLGNNLRSSGNCYDESIGGTFTNIIVDRIDKIIDIIGRCEGNKRVCIDALRNPMEILYFKDRYKRYYTFSINVDEDERCRRLSTLSNEELQNLDKVEYPQK